MNGANQPAFPGMPIEFIGPNGSEHRILGLTKREYFAGLAMQGQLAFSPMDDAFAKEHLPAGVARISVEMSDALLAELSKAEAPHA